jgi:hypothetical protein
MNLKMEIIGSCCQPATPEFTLLGERNFLLSQSSRPVQERTQPLHSGYRDSFPYVIATVAINTPGKNVKNEYRYTYSAALYRHNMLRRDMYFNLHFCRYV